MSTGTLSEKVQGLPGTLYLERRENGTIEGYFRYTAPGGSRRKRKIGTYRLTDGGGGMTLVQMRDKAKELAQVAEDHGDIEEFYAAEAEQAARAKSDAERLQAIESSMGTFTELFKDFIESRKGKVQPKQIDTFENYLKGDLIKPFPEIMSMKAKEIQPKHIQTIINKVYHRGAKRQAEKIRSALNSAFVYELQNEYAVGKTSEKSYGLISNPVQAVPVPSAKNPGDRALTEAELKQFWSSIDEVPGVGKVIAAAIKFAIATGGQRIGQIVRQEWDSYNREAKTFTIIDRKGRNSKVRVAILPLTDRAIGLLDEVRGCNESGCLWPFSSEGKTIIHDSTFSHVTSKWFKTDHAYIDGERIPKFTPRDLRRTISQIMERACIDNESSDLLQNHGLTGVVAEHYRNNPEAAIPRNRLTIERFEQELARILDGE
ncbi:tyrosine-type recombinase/integrase [Pseudomonas sp. NPDC008258]|uniref:tyrosine-type recombinase/integrase n=1 Tax=Pseudomonas sp. NPDC008258 TaxID=3364418 RepID=UPI0036EC1D2E